MKPRGRLTVALAATMAAGAILVGPGVAAAEGPRPFAPRYAATVWGNLVQTGNALVAAEAGGTAGDVATAWIDTDADQSTVNSSSARLAVPPGAGIAWAGLYWSGERGWTDPDGVLRCGAAPFSATPSATPPPFPAPAPTPPGEPAQVKVGVGDDGYTGVTATDLDEIVDPSGGTLFQGFADITGLLRAYPRKLETVTVADVALAPGRNCGGGWALLLAYSYPGATDQATSPDPAHAPALRSLTVHDGFVEIPAGGSQEVALNGLRTPAKGDPDAHLGLVIYHRPAGAVETVAVNGSVVKDAASGAGCSSTVDGGGFGTHLGDIGPADPPSCRGAGYDATESRLPRGTLVNGATTATVQIRARGAAALPGVMAVSTRILTQVDLSVTAALSPASALVGSTAQLTLAVANDSPVEATGVSVTSLVPAGLVITEPPPAYDNASGIWAVGKVPARATVTLVLKVRVERAGSLVSTAEVTASDWPDADSVPADRVTGQDDLATAALTVAAPPTTEAPPATAQAQAPTSPGFTLPFNIPPFALIGVGLVMLGLVLLLAVVIRARAHTDA